MRSLLTFVLFIQFQVFLFAGGGFYETSSNLQKVIFKFAPDGNWEWKSVTYDVNGKDYLSKSSGDFWSLIGGEAFLWCDNYTEIKNVYLNYRIYKEGTIPGVFNGIWLDQRAFVGGNNTRFYNESQNINILDPLILTSGGKWFVEFYYSAVTNGVNSSTDLYFNNGGSNYKLYFTTESALPVELSSFTALISNEKIDLKWDTITEINNYGFEIERKTEKENWRTIGFVEGSGNSNSPKSYSYVDTYNAAVRCFYRLKQIDNDGNYRYSHEIELFLSEIPEDMLLESNYPNPFNPSTNIRFAFSISTETNLKVYSQLGEEITTLYSGIAEAGKIYNIPFNASGLPSGIYYYKLSSSAKSEIRKMVLIK